MSAWFEFYVEMKDDKGEWHNICPVYKESKDGKSTPLLCGCSIIGQILDEVSYQTLSLGEYDANSIFEPDTIEHLKEEQKFNKNDYKEGETKPNGWDVYTGIVVGEVDKNELLAFSNHKYDREGIVTKLQWDRYNTEKNYQLNETYFEDDYKMNDADKMMYEYHQWVDSEGALKFSRILVENARVAVEFYCNRSGNKYSDDMSLEEDRIRIVSVES